MAALAPLLWSRGALFASARNRIAFGAAIFTARTSNETFIETKFLIANSLFVEFIFVCFGYLVTCVCRRVR